MEIESGAWAVPVRSGRLGALFPATVGAAELEGEAPRVAPWPGEAASLDRAVDKRRREFDAGRACARAALALIGVPPLAIPMGADRAPQWPPGWVGSITHTAGYCAAVVAPASRFAGLGIDAERVGAVRVELWRRLFTPAEMGWLERRPHRLRPSGATLLFCAKEALYKSQYPQTRRWLEFQQVEVEVEVEVEPGASGAVGEYHVTVRPEPGSSTADPPIRGRYRIEAGLLLASAWHPVAGAG